MTSTTITATQTIYLTLIGIDGLSRNRFFGNSADPFCVVSIDGGQTHSTAVIKRTNRPFWNETFKLQATDQSIITIHVFDQRRSLKHRNRQHLGFIEIGLKAALEMQAEASTLNMTMQQSRARGKLSFSLKTTISLSQANGFGTTSVLGSTPPPQQSDYVNTQPLLTPSSSTEVAATSTNVEIGMDSLLLNAALLSSSQGEIESESLFSRDLLVDCNNQISAHHSTWTIPSARSSLQQRSELNNHLQDTHELPIERSESAITATTQASTQSPEISFAIGESHIPPLSTHGLTTCDSTELQNNPTTTTSGIDTLTARLVETCIALGDGTFIGDYTSSRQQQLDYTKASRPYVQSYLESLSALGPIPIGWEMRLTPGGRVFFVDHYTDTTTWEDPRLPDKRDKQVPQYKRDFRRKLVYFQSQQALQPLAGQCYIKVRRNHIFEDAYDVVMQTPTTNLKKKLMVKFAGEDGLDYGGVSREFFFLLSQEIFDPNYCLFEYSTPGNYTLQINPHSGINSDHLVYFKFIGRVVGLAIFHRRFLDTHFIVPFYKMLLAKKVCLADLESIDSEFHRSLLWILNNNITDSLELTFSTEDDRFGKIVTTDLKPDGHNIEVTEANKTEYVALLTEWRISKRVKEQFEAFKEGFHQLIPQNLVNIFDERELEFLVGGTAEIDVDDWEEHTDYRGGYRKHDETIQWFWKCVHSWDNEKKSRLLQFTTGTSRIPINGFEDLQGSDGPRRFTIDKSYDGDGGLPKAHTCFNRIVIPVYGTYDIFTNKLQMALEETEGFGND